MRRLLTAVVLVVTLAAVLAPREVAAAPASVELEASRVLSSGGLWSLLGDAFAGLWARASKDGSLMDPNGSPASADPESGRSPGNTQTPPGNTDHGFLMNPDG